MTLNDFRSMCVLVLVACGCAVLAGCGGSADAPLIVTVSKAASTAGACSSGYNRFAYGRDLDESGALDESEVDGALYACGDRTVSVIATALPPGDPACPQSGVVLTEHEAGEADTQHVLCAETVSPTDKVGAIGTAGNVPGGNVYCAADPADPLWCHAGFVVGSELPTPLPDPNTTSSHIAGTEEEAIATCQLGRAANGVGPGIYLGEFTTRHPFIGSGGPFTVPYGYVPRQYFDPWEGRSEFEELARVKCRAPVAPQLS